MKYLVTYITGNGEWCHCHRKTSTQTEEYYDLENVAADMLEKWKGYGGDLLIKDIRFTEEVNEEIVVAIKKDFIALTKKANEAEKNHKQEDEERSERRLLARLKEKYKK